MRSGIILVIFFLMFTVATLLVPCPMFPGNFLCTFVGATLSRYTQYLSAFFNGIFYGIVMWLIFAGISRRLEQEK